MKYYILTVTALLIAGSVVAAPNSPNLASTNGSVLVNQGKQFVTAKPGQLLSVGDRVMVMEGGSAVVRYPNGCLQTLNSGSLAVVSDQANCVLGKNVVTQIAPVSAQAVGESERDCDDDGIVDSKDGDIDGDDVLNTDDKYESCKAGAYYANSNTGIWVVAGLAAAGAAVLISDGDDETISP